MYLISVTFNIATITKYTNESDSVALKVFLGSHDFCFEYKKINLNKEYPLICVSTPFWGFSALGQINKGTGFLYICAETLSGFSNDEMIAFVPYYSWTSLVNKTPKEEREFQQFYSRICRGYSFSEKSAMFCAGVGFDTYNYINKIFFFQKIKTNGFRLKNPPNSFEFVSGTFEKLIKEEKINEEFIYQGIKNSSATTQVESKDIFNVEEKTFAILREFESVYAFIGLGVKAYIIGEISSVDIEGHICCSVYENNRWAIDYIKTIKDQTTNENKVSDIGKYCRYWNPNTTYMYSLRINFNIKWNDLTYVSLFFCMEENTLTSVHDSIYENSSNTKTEDAVSYYDFRNKEFLSFYGFAITYVVG